MDRLGERYEPLFIMISSSSGYADGKLLAVEKLQHITVEVEEISDVLALWNVKM